MVEEFSHGTRLITRWVLCKIFVSTLTTLELEKSILGIPCLSVLVSARQSAKMAWAIAMTVFANCCKKRNSWYNVCVPVLLSYFLKSFVMENIITSSADLDLSEACGRQVNHYLGRLLTVVDATFSDPEQRKAFKDVCRDLVGDLHLSIEHLVDSNNPKG